MADATAPALRFARDCLWGLCGGVFFGALVLVFDVGHLATLTHHAPLAMLLIAGFAVVVFEPAVFCVSVAAWRSGLQFGPCSTDDEED